MGFGIPGGMFEARLAGFASGSRGRGEVSGRLERVEEEAEGGEEKAETPDASDVSDAERAPSRFVTRAVEQSV
jgi:hypothetical protein